MRRIGPFLTGAWLLTAPLTGAAATSLGSAPSDASAADRSAPRYVQNNAVPVRPFAHHKYPQAQGPAKVYLLRGFLNVFSLGMDDIAAKLEADGISATVTNHADADLIAGQIVTAYTGGDHGPVILVGHSLGADAIVDVADAAARYNVPIALLVLFDGTETHQIPANVVDAINYTKHFMITPAIGSSGQVSNVDFSSDASIDHLNIDRVPSLQTQALDYILQAASAVPREPVSRRR
jgi:hypothetical protein